MKTCNFKPPFFRKHLFSAFLFKAVSFFILQIISISLEPEESSGGIFKPLSGDNVCNQKSSLCSSWKSAIHISFLTLRVFPSFLSISLSFCFSSLFFAYLICIAGCIAVYVFLWFLCSICMLFAFRSGLRPFAVLRIANEVVLYIHFQEFTLRAKYEKLEHRRTHRWEKDQPRTQESVCLFIRFWLKTACSKIDALCVII